MQPLDTKSRAGAVFPCANDAPVVMMESMAIPLTCTCGQRQFVAHEMAGQTTACVMCGNVMNVPAMGRLATAKVKPKARRARRAPSKLLVVFAIVGFLMFAIGGIWLTWAINRRGADEPPPIAQHQALDVGPQRSIEPLPERRRPESEKKDPPQQLVEPVPTKDPPRIVVEPAKQIVEPEPVKPKAPPVVEKKPPNVLEPLRLVWKLKDGDSFFQELIVTQKPIFKVQDVLVASMLQYRIVSRFTVKQANEDGSLVVDQKIVSAKLLQADDLTKSTLGGAIAQLPGATYTLQLNAKMDVTKFAGAAGGVKIGGLDLGVGVQMASLIDRDGWKELAQATFFQMDRPLQVNQRWSKPLTHHWGGLGSWTGLCNYAYLGQQGPLHKIAYGLQLAYKAPVGGAIGLMTVNGANFQAQEAGGVLLFDAAKGKVVSAEERFRVKGVINANLLGQNTTIEIEENQHFLIRIHDKLP